MRDREAVLRALETKNWNMDAAIDLLLLDEQPRFQQKLDQPPPKLFQYTIKSDLEKQVFKKLEEEMNSLLLEKIKVRKL